ncbi:hypothetical protein QYE76_057903 [Lolium multiflorum]|uniref:Uncharacterized protein n=1 Tax=Lolium multiflorum TaxID=4521 RepID=A0AAD8WP73_LOLMU|nr:hypothetical protein QYE76_057903 [Lolium multiflorum]
MVKKKNPAAAAISTSGGTAAKASSNLPKRSASDAPHPAPAPSAPPSSVATAKPGDWLASSITKRDEKRARSLGLISSDEGNVILPAVEEARAPPAKRSTGGFADEDDLFDSDEGLIEPPPKKAKSDAALPDVAASKASAPTATPAAQISTASSLSKEKNILSTVATATPPSGKTDLRGVISSLEAFASQFTSLEADKVRLQKEVNSSSLKLEGANKIVAAARQDIDSLKEELNRLTEKLKEEEASRLIAEARATEKDELLHQSSLALLEAADIPADALDKIPHNSPANSVSMTLAAHQLTRELLDKGKGAMARMHSMIFPKISQDKTLGQLIDAFAVNTKEVIEIFPVPAFVDDSPGALSEVIALNRAEENKRIHERVKALTQLSSAEENFWREHSKASAVTIPRSGPAGPPFLRQVLQSPKGNLEDDVPLERGPSYAVDSDV